MFIFTLIILKEFISDMISNTGLGCGCYSVLMSRISHFSALIWFSLCSFEEKEFISDMVSNTGLGCGCYSVLMSRFSHFSASDLIFSLLQ